MYFLLNEERVEPLQGWDVNLYVMLLQFCLNLHDFDGSTAIGVQFVEDASDFLRHEGWRDVLDELGELQ